MREEVSDSDLLRVAYDDERLRRELCRSSGKEWPQLLGALKSGPTHPSADSAIEWIKQLVYESRDTVATLTAKQDCGEYAICIYGFDQLCSIRALDFGQQGPFLSHDDAINFALDNWSEFLVSNEVELHRFPSSRAAVRALAAKEKRKAKKAPLVRYKLDFHEYSKVGRDKYYRYPRRPSEEGPPLSGSQLANSLVNYVGTISSELIEQLNATGWDEVISKVNRIAAQRKKQYEMAGAKNRAAFTNEVCKFFRAFLKGKDSNDPDTLDAAARAWVWRDFNIPENHPDYEDHAGAIQRHARQRHYGALNAYLAERSRKSIRRSPGVGI